jgi:Na+/H+ antiporter NhaD/arsenite permease-like protein
VLTAIAVGAVAMGANTYIGNAPNFMVKSIAERARVPMPGFLGYMLYSGGVLLPLFALVTLIFFRSA